MTSPVSDIPALYLLNGNRYALRLSKHFNHEEIRGAFWREDKLLWEKDRRLIRLRITPDDVLEVRDFEGTSKVTPDYPRWTPIHRVFLAKHDPKTRNATWRHPYRLHTRPDHAE